MEEALTRLREANKLPEDFLAEFVARAWRKIHPISRGTISCSAKHEKTDNKTLHRTPKAGAFFAFTISVLNLAYAKSSLAFGAGELHVLHLEIYCLL